MIKVSAITIEKLKNNKLRNELPSIYELKEVIENNGWHNHESVFHHTIEVLKYLDKMLANQSQKVKSALLNRIDKNTRKQILILACIFHDLGKKETLIKNQGQTACPNHERISAQKFMRLSNKIELSNRERNRVSKIIRLHSKHHIILGDAINSQNPKLIERFLNRKNKFEGMDLEVVLLSTADTGVSYLKKTSPKEYRFRMNYYKRILNTF